MIEPGTPVRFIGGKLSGFQGVCTKACEVVYAVAIVFEGKPVEVVEEIQNLAPLAEWLAAKSETEKALKGNPTL
jgi:hypothetical protein